MKGLFIPEITAEIFRNGCLESIEALMAEGEVYDIEYDPKSAQPDWIPCSEGMPEEHEWIGTKKFGTTISKEVYVTFETPDGERFTRHISFQNGKLSAVDEQHMKVWYKGAKPIAWMPLPEPYKGGTEWMI